MLFLNALAIAHRGAHTIHRVDGINGRGPRGFERLINRVNVAAEFLQVASAKSQRALGQSIGRRRADGAGAAHDHVVNGAGGFAEIFRGDDFEFVRQQPLFDEQNRISRGIESNGAIMPGTSADVDIHAITLQQTLIFIRRILAWISR